MKQKNINQDRKEKTIREEEEKKTSIDKFTLNFNRKLDGSINEGNEDIVRVSLDSLKKFGYQKVYFIIVQVSFEYFTFAKIILKR